MTLKTEMFSQPLLTQEALDQRRIKERSRKKAKRTGRMSLAVVGAGIAFVGGSIAMGKSESNPQKAKLRAELIAKSIPTAKPNVVIEPIDIGNTMKDTLLSEVAADLHPLADNQYAMDEIDVLETYQTDEQFGSGAFSPGEHIDVAVDTGKGEILPKSDALNSAPYGR